MDNQQSLSSSGQQQQVSEIESQQVEKKTKGESKSEGVNQNQTEVDNKCFIVGLPPEMLMKILGYLNVPSLALSRLVSRKWDGIARKIIQSRDDVETVFFLYTSTTGARRISILGEPLRGGLNNFMKHFSNSKEHLLYTRFRFDNTLPSIFESTSWITFISDFGQSIKCLKLSGKPNVEAPVQEIIQLAEKVRVLILNHLPELQEFGLLIYSCNIRTATIQLFPGSGTVQLPHLKVLHLNESAFLNYTGMVTDLLLAAANLTKIESFDNDTPYTLAETFSLLHSLGKLHCVQAAQIWLDTKFITSFQQQSINPLKFKLRTLDLNVDILYQKQGFWSDASVFISHLFESSKDTLRDLRMTPIGFLPDFLLPKFSKLTKFHILKNDGEDQTQALPVGVKLVESFHVLQNLELSVPFTVCFPHDDDEDDSRLPNLKTLKLTGHNSTKEDIVRISQVCPKLKELDLCHYRDGWATQYFPELGKAIWTHLTKLESLDLKIDLNSPANAFPAVDSTFVGFSGEDVIRLYDLIKAEELLKKSGWGHHIDFSTSELETERKNPSILDLKDLVKLQVSCSRWGFQQDIPKTMLVSDKYAFQLMGNLTYKIE